MPGPGGAASGPPDDQSGPTGPGPVVGVDLGGTKLLALRLDPDGSIVADPARASPTSGTDLVAEVVRSVERLCGGPAAAVGIGVPGLVDASGVVRLAPNLAGLNGAPLRHELEAALPGTRIWLGNDATAACWAEHRRGAGVGSTDMLFVALGTGIGGGIVAGGRLIEGAHGYAGEFGHMVVEPHGRHCGCGKRGCWERYASGGGVGVLGREKALAGRVPRVVELAGGDPESVRGEHVTIAAAEGDPAAVEILAEIAGWLALGLATLTNALDPGVIILGGGLASAGDALVGPTRRAFGELVEAGDARDGLRIERAALGERAGAVGAGLRAADLPDESPERPLGGAG